MRLAPELAPQYVHPRIDQLYQSGTICKTIKANPAKAGDAKLRVLVSSEKP
jgi:hypothetical protein